MPTTTNGLRYPAGSDTPDVPRDIQYLAQDIEAYFALATHDHTGEYATTSHAHSEYSLTSHDHAKLNNVRSFSGKLVGANPNANGIVTIVHGAPFTPDSALACCAVNDADSIITSILAGSYTSTQFKVKLTRNNGEPWTAQTRINWICFNA